MKTMYFKYGSTGICTLCQQPVKIGRQEATGNIVLEVIDIPDNVDAADVQNLVNKTAIWKKDSVSYSELGEGKIIK